MTLPSPEPHQTPKGFAAFRIILVFACGYFLSYVLRSVNAAIAPLLALFRERDWPVIYPHVAPKRAYDGGRLAEKIPSIMGIPAQGYEFVAELAPRDCDILVPKKQPSAFFATALASHLIDLGADTLIVTGCTTSGCVRASVVDAFSYNFRVTVPEECVYDRSRVSHAVNLFDMSEKYADVAPAAEVRSRLAAL